MIRDAARMQALLADLRQFVLNTCIPLEADIDRNDVIPEPVVDAMRQLGLFGHSIPEAYGGAGLTSEELTLVNIEVSQAATVFRARFGGNTGIASESLVVDGTEAQKTRYLPRLASGELTGCFALTEPEAGSDATSLLTSARRDGDHYVLNGSKCFITNAPVADLFTVFARTDSDTPGAHGISAFLVERGTPGISTGEPERKMGQHGSPVGDVYLQDCRVSATAIVGGQPGVGFKTAMKALNKQRINLAGLCIGPAIRLVDEMVRYASQRRQFGKPIADYQLVQQMIADSNTDIHAARALVLETARRRDNGEDVTMEASMCKLFASEMCGRVADRAVQIFGGSGYMARTVAERFYRDVRLFRLYEGTTQIHQLNIAKRTMQAREGVLGQVG
ncbi:acyl-CoA dehydrogenase family protein [Cupriavidus oxalaticus]|uniref:Acryloyl-CoA reductase (NADH) n=1 Tax=Cupriavidus oxalaticus TaxID=96344 RepID=A0A976BDK3_9BURK|nr:acyl-CoA dehydrogenase family protein [Cupriavidus oxalaticus]QRQ87865.1 acyl-CoA dehydrogenase family protein [Cupriavidus oxalaticus]QRQ93808.1 acyl-CoA dehydrogenase family protein [Cupriavidus oxalaticus]WQD82438.1 acyl-CoA dehydrogenase family protein [Cupriavidus oxalaticus]SPC14902.1 Acryloyl-CoA reductase (NADH) [Cupriavidus oxalaticus]